MSTYSEISGKRINYDIDGSIVGVDNDGSKKINAWVTSNNITLMNGTGTDTAHYFPSGPGTIWFFFTEAVNITAMCITLAMAANVNPMFREIVTSLDTTNGIDGTWETVTFPNGSPLVLSTTPYNCLNGVKTMVASPCKVIRMTIGSTDGGGYQPYLRNVHFYGTKVSGQTPDDISFCDVTTGTEFSSEFFWGDVAENSTPTIKSFKIKNLSTTKSANNINLSIVDNHFILSTDQSNWVTSIDISSINIGDYSNPIYVKNTVGAHPQPLGPRTARIITTVNNWI